MSGDPALKHHRTRVRQWEAAETEEDLLRLQEQFLADKEKNSTTCVRTSKKPEVDQSSASAQAMPMLESLPVGPIKENDTDSVEKEQPSVEKEKTPRKKLSLFAQRRREAAKEGGEGREGRSLSNLMGSIVERPMDSAPSFPTLTSIEASPSEEEDMARLVERYMGTGAVKIKDEENEGSAFPSFSSPPATSTYARMDEENRTRVDRMNPEERKEALEELEGMVDVESLRSFFASRRDDPQLRAQRVEKALGSMSGTSSSVTATSKNPQSNEERKHVTFDDSTKPETKEENEEDEDEDTPGGLRKHFPSSVPTESDKMAWMDEQMEAKSSKGTSSSPASASSSSLPRPVGLQTLSHTAAGWRFDLKGNLLTGKEEVNRHEGLHHHGDDPDKAGYTVQELLWLARSAVGAQRSMAWRMLTGLVASVRWRTGGLGEEEARDVYDLLLRLELAMWVREAVQDRTLGVVVGVVDVLWAWVQDRWEGPGEVPSNTWGYKDEEKRLLRVCTLIQVAELIKAIQQARSLPMDTIERMDRVLTCLSWIAQEGGEATEEEEDGQ
ncbi:RPAP1-like protein [Piptocephalis cylindrospora]|uniref:RPAP1-like protein n=1 Tax=Piptocephalis cylindrospora TaxID=1907219 RepID=A0A4P9Y435_9FUNG|nr:RPAP1-like protein [Piptocephalis cylindrospora]|eukprot:RKP13716.1 RPAP1-like protein [Piptocephalis cylindrospora]